MLVLRAVVRLTAVVLVAAVVACGGGDPPAATRGPSAAPASSAAAHDRDSDVAVTTTPAVEPRASSAAAAAPSASEPAPVPSATRPPGLPSDSRCHEPTYRCTTLPEALRWWAGKPALVPAGATRAVRAMLHTASDPAVRTSTDADYAPDFSYVLPDAHFSAMTRRKGGVSSAAVSGGVVVRTYFATERWIPTRAPWSRTTTVRGQDAVVTEYRPSDGRTALRDVTWYVPHGEGTYVVWYVADDPRKRTEAELVRMLDALVPA